MSILDLVNPVTRLTAKCLGEDDLNLLQLQRYLSLSVDSKMFEDLTAANKAPQKDLIFFQFIQLSDHQLGWGQIILFYQLLQTEIVFGVFPMIR